MEREIIVNPSMKSAIITFVLFGFIIVGIIIASFCIETVEPGYVKVATLFGKTEKSFEEGLHFVNPLYKFHSYDVREKTLLSSNIAVPSGDQLLTRFDVSINYRIDRKSVKKTLPETGSAQNVIDVHMIPTFRSLLREVGKEVKNAEEFYSRQVQQRVQEDIFIKLNEYCLTKGLIIQKVLIRNIELPTVITQAVEEKKRQQQLAEQQKAELIRYKVEQEQKLAQAQADFFAAEERSKQIRLIADADAYQIDKISQAIANNPAYLQLKAIEALKEISKNPASQIYFLNADSPHPFPLMNIGKDIIKNSK